MFKRVLSVGLNSDRPSIEKAEGDAKLSNGKHRYGNAATPGDSKSQMALNSRYMPQE